jgi:hypothetical protein
MGYGTGMVTVTRIHKDRKPVPHLRAHRKAKGMAGRLGIERESVYRQEREPGRLDEGGIQEWAEALGIEPEALFVLPGATYAPSLDKLVENEPLETKLMVADIVRRLVNKR